MRGYCWRIGSTVELGGKCPECGALHDPIPDQTQCAAYVEMHFNPSSDMTVAEATSVWAKAWGMPCTLPYGHKGECRHLPDSPGLEGQASATDQATHVPVDGDER